MFLSQIMFFSQCVLLDHHRHYYFTLRHTMAAFNVLFIHPIIEVLTICVEKITTHILKGLLV